MTNMKKVTSMGIGLAVVVALCVLGFVYEQVSRRRDAKRRLPGTFIELDGRRLHFVDRGEGGPTVVLIHGAGDCSYSWMYVQEQVAAFTRAVAYDRPGLGSSDAGPAPDPVATVEELHLLLERAAIPGPYILAGHSLGGMIARLYARRYPHQVAGLVFLDSTHEHLVDDAKFRQGFAVLGVMLKLLQGLSAVGVVRLIGDVFGVIPMFVPERSYYQRQLSAADYRLWKGIVYRNFARPGGSAEFKAVGAILAAAAGQLRENADVNADERPAFGDLPIAVVCNPSFGAKWLEMQRELASRSTDATYRVSDRKGHSVQMPRPEYVVDAIRHVVQRARERGGRTLAD